MAVFFYFLVVYGMVGEGAEGAERTEHALPGRHGVCGVWRETQWSEKPDIACLALRWEGEAGTGKV